MDTTFQPTPPLALVSAIEAAEADLRAALETLERQAEARQRRDQLREDLAEVRDSVRWLQAERRALSARAPRGPLTRAVAFTCGVGAAVGTLLAVWVW